MDVTTHHQRSSPRASRRSSRPSRAPPSHDRRTRRLNVAHWVARAHLGHSTPWRSATNVDPNARTMPASRRPSAIEGRKGRSEMGQPNRHRRWFEDLESFSRRVLTTVLFTDVVDSTGRVCELGDRTWADVLRTHHARFRDRLGRFGGREVDAAGDGFLAAFDIPSTRWRSRARSTRASSTSASRSARASTRASASSMTAGSAGVAVHVGARLASLARPGEVLVSSTVRDVVAGSGLRFADRGLHELRGVPGQRRLFAARWDESGAFTAARAAGPRAAAGVTHRRQPGTARGHGRRGMKGSRVRDRSGPAGLPLAGAPELERVAPARAVGRVLERLEPSGLAPGQEHRQPEVLLARPQVLPSSILHPDHRHREVALGLQRLAPLGGLGSARAAGTGRTGPRRGAGRARPATSTPSRATAISPRPARSRRAQHSSFPRLIRQTLRRGTDYGNSATCRSSSRTTRRRARFCSSRSSSRASNENAHTLNRTPPASTRRTHSSISRARFIDLASAW